MTKTKVEVIIERQEANNHPEMVNAFSSHPEVESWKVMDLAEGDFIIGNIIVERKTPTDFAASVTDKKRSIFDQTRRMRETGLVPYVLVEGDMRNFETLKHTRLNGNALRGATARLETQGVSVIFCSHMLNLVDMAVRLARKWQEEPSSTFIKAGDVDDYEASETVRMLSTIQGIGKERAEALEARYGTVLAVSMAMPSEIEKLDGFGPKSARRVYDAFRGVK